MTNTLPQDAPPAPAVPRGTLIVMEGLDRAGKTTQAELLVQRLTEELGADKVRHMRFPNRQTPMGQLIDRYLAGESNQEDHVIHLLFSANRWECADEITRLLTTGTTVIIDRYIYSGVVYSASKGNPALDPAWAAAPDVGLPRPDLCVFLDLDPAAAAARAGYGGERYETGAMQARVREAFDALFATGWGREVVRVDAGREVDAVRAEVWRVVRGVMDSVDGERRALGRVAPLEEG